MQIVLKTSSQIVVMVSQDETAALSQALNEALHGFHLDDRDRRLGTSREDGKALLQRLLGLFHEYTGDEKREINLSIDEAKWLQNAAKLCLEHIDEREFSTRIGASFDEVKETIYVLEQAAGESPSTH